MLQRNTLKMACVAIIIGLFTTGLQAQIASNTITGTVRDASGAVVPGAAITLTNQATTVTTNAKSNAVGQYTFPYLQEGIYTVSVSASGFATYRENGLHVANNQIVRADVTLKLGTPQQLVQVSADVAQLQTESATVQDSIQAPTIAALPNITENPLYYADLENGVVPRGVTSLTQQTTWMNSFGIGFYGRMNWSAVGVNGGRAYTNAITLDGLPDTGSGYNEVAVVPNTESLSEVNVISTDYSAEYGRGQGIIVMMTKSGANQFHGELNYHLRNDLLNASSNYDNAYNIAKPPFKLNDYGGALGGPIWKKKLFFFTSLHFMRFNQGIVNVFTIPTAEQRAGDFSQTLIPSYTGQPVPAEIFNPFSVTQVGPNLYQRAQYPNAVITNPNPYAVHIFSLYPLPNRSPIDVYGDDNFSSTSPETFRKIDNNARLDYYRGNQSFYLTAGIGYGNILNQSPWGPTSLYFPGGVRQTRDFNPYVQVGDTIVLSPTLVADVRAGLTRINMTYQGGGQTSGFTDYNGWGIPSSVQAIMPDYGGTPDVLPGSWEPLNNSTNTNKREWQTIPTIEGSLTKSSGRWTNKIGGQFIDMRAIWQDFYELSADISSSNFTSEYVTANGTNTAQDVTAQQQGFPGASLLTGAGGWDVQRNMRPILSAHYFGLYSQNDWRPTSKLEVNLGLRWDFQPAPIERHNREASFNLNATNAWGTKGTICFVGVNCSALWNSEYTDFQPRLGVAYQLNSRTVLRGGFGITSLPTNTGNYSSNLLYYEMPFRQVRTISPTG